MSDFFLWLLIGLGTAIVVKLTAYHVAKSATIGFLAGHEEFARRCRERDLRELELIAGNYKQGLKNKPNQ